MNLLIEQRATTIISKRKQQLTSENDINNSLSSSLVLKLKRQTTKEQIDINSSLLKMANEDKNNFRSTTNNQRSKRPIQNSTAFNGKQQTTKRSVTIDNNNNDLTPHIDENSLTKKFKQNDLNQTSTTKVDASVETISIGLATEPDQLGPCEPGTSVVLEGIVWNETDSGVLVVNVTWRGKTYVGTLLDSTKQDWACPRLVCESPTSDYDARNSSKTSRSKRTSTNGNNRCSNFHLQPNTYITGSDDRKLRNNIKSRQSKRIHSNTTDETLTNNSSPLTSPYRTTTTFFSSSSNCQTSLITCPESQCYKQFVSSIALNYHLSDAHKKTDSNLSSSIQQTNTRDEEDVAHILANVADYVRRTSPDHQRHSTLTWPCPQISSNPVLSSSLNNDEQTTNSLRCVNKNETNSQQNEIKSTIKRADHFLLQIQDNSSCKNSKTNELDNKKSTVKISTPPPSSFVPINFPSTNSSSPAYSDISDEDPTTESISNILTSTNGKDDKNESSWTTTPTQILLQPFGSYLPQQTFINKDLTSNRLNSKNDNSDSTIKNILDSRRLSRKKSSSTPSPTITSNESNNLIINDYQKNLYNFHSNDSKLSTTILNKFNSPNENLLNPSINPLDYSLNSTSSSTIQPSR